MHSFMDEGSFASMNNQNRSAINYGTAGQPRKRPLIDSTNNNQVSDEPQQKKLLASDSNFKTVLSLIERGQQKMQNLAAKSDKPKPVNQQLRELRCISGEVKYVLETIKKYPNLYALYEIYANVFKIRNSQPGKWFILLRNNSGPILQSVYYDIDRPIAALNVGDSVRCVGKIFNGSQFQIFKVVKTTQGNPELVPRLTSICDFAISKTH